MKNEFKERARVELCELAGEHKESWAYEYESFVDFLLSKCKRSFDFPQVMCYSIVGHMHDAVIFEIEGYEE